MQEATPQDRTLAWARRHFPDAEVELSFGNVVTVQTDDVPPWMCVLVSGPTPLRRGQLEQRAS